MTGYELSRAWFDFCFDNPEKINPNHTAIYFFAIEHNNRLAWRDKFGFPTTMAMDALGIKNYHTYIKYFNDLVDWGFIVLIEKSKNQYSSNIISLDNALLKNSKATDKAHSKALDKALAKHLAKQSHYIKTIEQEEQSNNLTIEQDTADKSAFPLCVKVYFDFYENHTGIKPKFDKVQGSALKKIISYVKTISTNGTEPETIADNLKIIFDNHQKWDGKTNDQFLRKQLKLTQIDSNLVNIINNIKNGHKNPNAEAYAKFSMFD